MRADGPSLEGLQRELLPGQHLARVASQREQQVELGLGHVDRGVAHHDLASTHVDDQLTHDVALLLLVLRPGHGGVPLHRQHPRAQPLRRGRQADHVEGPAAQEHHLLRVGELLDQRQRRDAVGVHPA